MKKALIGTLVVVFLLSSLGWLEAGDPPPKKLKVGITFSAPAEQSWDRNLLVSLDNLKKQGYDLDVTYMENLSRENVESAIRNYIEEGYDVVINHMAAGADVVERIHNEFPDFPFLSGGAGGKVIQSNVGFYDQCMYETAYLCGVIGGMMTKSNILGGVGAFPIPNVNSLFNAFERGALSVNPKVKFKFSYIESWFDPTKAKEAALAQIAAGADYILQERDGVVQACQDKGVYAFGVFMDMHKLAPDTVVTSAVNDWAPAMKEAFDKILSGNFEAKDYTKCFAGGGAVLAPYYNFEDKIPPEIKKKVAKLAQDIKEGRLVIPLEPQVKKRD